MLSSKYVANDKHDEGEIRTYDKTVRPTYTSKVAIVTFNLNLGCLFTELLPFLYHLFF